MVRAIIIPKTQTVFFEVPEEYVGKELEVIAFTRNEILPSNLFVKKTVSFTALSLDTRNFKFNREEANER